MSGRVVSTIPSHGAVARSVAAEAHTAFPACNLRLTFNLPSFTISTVNLSRRSEVNSQTPLLLFFNIHYQLLRCLHKVSARTLFLPMKGNPTWPFSLCDSWVEIWVNLQPNYRQKHFSLCLFVTTCQICINRLLHTRCPDSVCVVSKHCCTPLPH